MDAKIRAVSQPPTAAPTAKVETRTMSKGRPAADSSAEHTKAERVYRELRRRIRELDLQPGSRLQKNEIALEFG
ncbi:MAG TPA: hypothetical protein VIH25_04770, partial [Steroidobacteraceae bacterium]